MPPFSMLPIKMTTVKKADCEFHTSNIPKLDGYLINKCIYLKYNDQEYRLYGSVGYFINKAQAKEYYGEKRFLTDEARRFIADLPKEILLFGEVNVLTDQVNA